MQERYSLKKIRYMNLENYISGKAPRESQERRPKAHFKGAFIVFLIIGTVIIFRHNIIEVDIITAQPKTTFIGEGVFIQTYEKSRPQLKVAFNLPESRFISRSGRGYLLKVPKFKANLEIVLFRPKVTLVGKDVFVQSLERCSPKLKLSFL